MFSYKDKVGATPNIYGKSIPEILDKIKDESGLVLEITKYNIKIIKQTDIRNETYASLFTPF